MGDGKEAKVCGVVSHTKIMTTKKGDRMAYIQLEDLHGTVEVILFPETFRNSESLLGPESVLRVTGTIDLMENGARLKATKVESIPQLETETVSHVTLTIQEGGVYPENLLHLREVFDRHPGPTPVSLAFSLEPNLKAKMSQLPNVRIAPTPEFLEDVEQVLGASTVTFN